MLDGLFSPAGPIAESERLLLIDSLGIMLAIVIPTIVVTIAFAWWFRAGNTKARFLPDWSYSGRVELIVWAIPILMILFLGGITWVSSHELDPAKPIDSKTKALNIQVVSLDWKWLFIYPDQHVASINRLVVPAGTPLHLSITSASVFNLFFVPRLGSGIYAMNGMTTTLYLQADSVGSYPGLSAHFSGDGFSDMSFNADAVSPADFEGWVKKTQTSGDALDEKAYRGLLVQSTIKAPYTYKTVTPGLFDAIIEQKLPEGDGPKESGAEKTPGREG